MLRCFGRGKTSFFKSKIKMLKNVKKVYVVGHKNPDTDSVASAIAYAELKNIEGIDARPLVSGDINKGTALALKTFGVRCPRHSHKADYNDAAVVLVDHNEEGQWPSGVEKKKVIEVVDHHRVGENFSTDHPIFVRVEPVGATSTIISKMYYEKGKKPEIHVAGLLLSAILTDTLMLRSPSTTEDDRKMVKWLNARVKVNMKAHAEEIFAAKSDTTGLSILDIVKKDFKEFHFNHETRVGISMFETINPKELLLRAESINNTLTSFKKRQKLNEMIFVIVNIKKMTSLVLCESKSEEKIIKNVFGKNSVNGLVDLPGIVSRKTQLVPALEKYFTK